MLSVTMEIKTEFLPSIVNAADVDSHLTSRIASKAGSSIIVRMNWFYKITFEVND
jgi:hypothetical protein